METLITNHLTCICRRVFSHWSWTVLILAITLSTCGVEISSTTTTFLLE